MQPILFNTDMVRAILEGRKTVTRRVVKPQFATDADGNRHVFSTADGNLFVWADKPNIKTSIRPLCKTGDILYVRETWSPVLVRPKRYIYKADADVGTGEGAGLPIKWHPSIHMPKEAARLFLRVTAVRVERLQAITIDDVRREGLMRENVRSGGCTCAWSTEGCKGEPCSNRDAYEWLCWATPFQKLWDTTIKPADLPFYGWEANPWVWVIEFERISKDAVRKEGAD